MELRPSPARRHSPLLRRSQPRRRHLRRQDLLRHARCASRRAEQGHRQGRLEQEVW
ncbi:hypothetical protein MGSAQ_000223 [marine sediment metagenome]|uniref:Uncharacterized protein n=1 Tax=marine sediment metagenome TaxID=412755 RepID=A0A1B6NY08_9ZZZZ